MNSLIEEQSHKPTFDCYQLVQYLTTCFIKPGTMLLNEMLQNEAIDFFVLYSSITSVLGNNGQTVYAAANAFLNSFAEFRTKTLKKPCLSVCWGAMGGGGMLARNTNVAMLLEKSGLHLLDIPTGIFCEINRYIMN